MTSNFFNQLRLDIGLLTPCTDEENNYYSEILKNGGKLPEGIIRSPYSDDKDQYFYKPNPTVQDGKEIQYTLMRISRDLHFISNLLKVFLVFGIIAAIAVPIIIAALG